MDDDLNDLFGENPPLQIPVPLPKGLLHRMDELCTSGCRQKVAWSRIGCIAYLGPESRTVYLQHLVCNPRNGQWQLSPLYSIDDLGVSHGESDLVHLAWSHGGADLAVVDIAGRVSIHVVYGAAMNRLIISRRAILDPEDDLASLIGFMWLYKEDRPERPSGLIYRPNVKSDNQWNFSCAPYRLAGPYVPRDKLGYVCVTKLGVLKVVYQGTDRWTDLKAEIQAVTEPGLLLTHAAISTDKSIEKGGLLIVTYDNEQQLRLYRVSVDIEKSEINIRSVKIISELGPRDQDPVGSDGFDKYTSPAILTYLDVLPAGPESKSRAAAPPLILAGFSRLADDLQAGGEQMTILSRWEIENGKTALHPLFDTLSSNAPSGVDRNSTESVLKRMDDISICRTLIAVQQINCGIVMAFLYSDGCVEFRERSTMALLAPDVNEHEISSLPHIGFQYPEAGPYLTSILSPNACALFALDENHSQVLSLLQYSKTLNGEAMNDTFFERMCEAFVMQCTYVGTTQLNYAEDVYFALQIFTNQYLVSQVQTGELPFLAYRDHFCAHLCGEMFRMLDIDLDHSMDTQPDAAFRKFNLQRCLNLQASLGFYGTETRRSLPGLVAWTLLNSRFCAIFFATSCVPKPPNAPKPPSGADFNIKSPETVYFLLGFIKWHMDLVGYLVDEIFSLSDALDDRQLTGILDTNFLKQHISATHSPALLLLFISTSRAILRFNSRSLHSLIRESKQQPHTTALGRAYREFDTILARSHVDLARSERLFSQIDASIKAAYQAAGLAEAKAPAREAAERNMLLKAEIPDVLIPVVKQLVTTMVEGLKEEVNVAELFFADVAWLGLTENGASGLSKRPVDAMRKVELAKGKRVRRCTRCCALMEDELPRAMGAWMVHMMSSCLCGGRWMVLRGNEDVA